MTHQGAAQWCALMGNPDMTFDCNFGRLYPANATRGLPFLSIRFGRYELFAQRETAPAARYGFTREGAGDAILDLPGWSIAFAWRQAQQAG